MIFTRVLHDGLWAVINRKGHKKITFIRNQYETTDKEEIEFLTGLGYASDAEVAAPTTYDYAVRKKDENGEFTGNALRVLDEESQAEDYMLEKELDLNHHGIEKRPR